MFRAFERQLEECVVSKALLRGCLGVPSVGETVSRVGGFLGVARALPRCSERLLWGLLRRFTKLSSE